MTIIFSYFNCTLIVFISHIDSHQHDMSKRSNCRLYHQATTPSYPSRNTANCFWTSFHMYLLLCRPLQVASLPLLGQDLFLYAIQWVYRKLRCLYNVCFALFSWHDQVITIGTIASVSIFSSLKLPLGWDARIAAAGGGATRSVWSIRLLHKSRTRTWLLLG